MDKTLSTVKWINFALLLLLSFHLPIELLLYHGFRIAIFSEMYYVLLLTVTLTLQCRFLAKSESNRNIRICHNFGALLFTVIFIVTIISMIHFDDKGVFTFEGILGRVAVAYFMPLLVFGLGIQQFIRLSYVHHPTEKLLCVVNSVVLILYLVHSILHYLEIGYMVAFSDMLVIYLPVLLFLNITFWLAKQVRESMKLMHDEKSA